MQISQMLIAALALAFSADACKCTTDFGKGSPVDAATKSCCSKVGGTYSGNDCEADSISNKLAQFDTCCEVTSPEGMDSDCHCPLGCEGGKKREMTGKEFEA
jgi:hypothetical protein